MRLTQREFVFIFQRANVSDKKFNLWPSKSHLKSAEFTIMLFRTSQKHFQGSMC